MSISLLVPKKKVNYFDLVDTAGLISARGRWSSAELYLLGRVHEVFRRRRESLYLFRQFRP